MYLTRRGMIRLSLVWYSQRLDRTCPILAAARGPRRRIRGFLPWYSRRRYLSVRPDILGTASQS